LAQRLARAPQTMDQGAHGKHPVNQLNEDRVVPGFILKSVEVMWFKKSVDLGASLTQKREVITLKNAEKRERLRGARVTAPTPSGRRTHD